MKKKCGIYIHIPFCIRKCNYCDFLSAPCDDATKERYVEALVKEINSSKVFETHDAATIYFGGGTPSLLKTEQLEKIIEAIEQSSESTCREITLEVNPKTADYKKFVEIKKLGFNRLSIGMQSTFDDELNLLGRVHTFDEFLQCFEDARKAGFSNISIDIMSALPGQTLEKYEETLKRAVALNPEHISSYSLIIEENTPFYERYSKGKPFEKDLPDEELDRLMYKRTAEILKANGYERYEISNYAKSGFESRHNSSYWTGTDYVGFGAGASSLVDDVRYVNVRDIKKYTDIIEAGVSISGSGINNCDVSKWSKVLFEGLHTEVEHLDVKDKIEEFMFLGLRMCKGVSKLEFKKRFAQDIEAVYGEVIKKLENENLLEVHGDNLKLTELGLDISNYVFSEFML